MQKIPLLLSLLLLIGSLSCKKKKPEDSPQPSVPSASTGNPINEYVKPLPPPLQPDEESPTQLLDNTFAKEGDYSCKTMVYKAGYAFDENLVLNPQTNVIFPGALIDGNSIVTGAYKPLNLKRKGGILVSDLQVADGEGSVKLSEITQSNVGNAMTQLRNKELASPPPANITFEITEVHSMEQMKAAIGAGYGNKAWEVKTGFDFSQSSVQNKFLVKFAQVYYTMSIEAPIRPSDFISADNSLEEVKREIKRAAPCYVASTTYGRLAFLFIESSEERKKVEATLQATFKGGATNGNLQAEFKNDEVLSKCKVSGTIIGGNADDAVGALKGKDYMLEYITNKGSYGKESPGALISYKLALLSDNSAFRLVNATQYTLRECIKNTKGIKLEGFKAREANAEIYGEIQVVFGYEGETGETRRTLWSRTRDQAQAIEASGEYFHFEDNVVFNFDHSKMDKAKVRIEAYLERRVNASCTENMHHRSGSFLVQQLTTREGLEIDDNTGFLFLKDISVARDACLDDPVNPKIDVFFSFVQ